MGKTKVAIIGYGNIGKFTVDSVLSAPDMELVGVIEQFDKKPEELGSIPFATDINALEKPDVAILCVPSRSVESIAKTYLAMGINTVDCFDIHTSICETRSELDKAAKQTGKVCIVSAGWDPGTDSIVRALLEICAPKGLTYTNFGPGMSMGHTVAAKAINGVEAALSMTIPIGCGVHRRMVYVQLENGADFNKVESDIKADPYFSHDETHVIKVDDVGALIDRGHGVNMTRKGVSGKTDNQLFEFNMKINNPALTAQILVSCARAAMKQNPGAYTMIELPMIDMLAGDKEELIKMLV